LREVYLHIYSCIEAGDAPKAQSAARQWMNIIRERLSSVMSSSPTRDMEVQLHG
jgi:DNA-binding FadR family transcriptional regulator